MKILNKKLYGNGHVAVMLFGIKLYSYRPKHFVMGKNNIVKVPENVNVSFKVFGDNNKIIIQENDKNPHLNFQIGGADIKCDNCEFFVGKNTSMGDVKFVTAACEDGTKISIGSDCMFSIGVKLFPSDVHTILDEKGKITNTGKYIKIGNHVWIGANVSLMKNTEIADGCIIGAHSVVSGKFLEPNCIIAGNPARVVKRNIFWDRRKIKQFITEKNENN